MTLPVLMYHAVAEPLAGPLGSLAVPPPLLAEQLAALTGAGYELVGLTEALARYESGPADRSRLVALTFDDGYLDFLEQGLPILAAAKARATLYMATAHAGARADWVGPDADRFARLLTWSELRDVAGAGMEVGSHSFRHRPMDTLPGEVLTREVTASRRLIEDEVGVAVRSFCYPHGYHSRQVRKVVADAGHENACEVGRALHHKGRNRYAVPRLQPTAEHTGDDLLRMVSTGGPALLPTLKRAARPGWRAARLVAERRFGKLLT